MADNNSEELLSFQGYQPSPHLIAGMEAGDEPSAKEIRQDFLQQQQQQQNSNRTATVQQQKNSRITAE
jgi:hypothetical protein